MTDKPTCANCPYWSHPEREPKKRIEGDMTLARCMHKSPTPVAVWPTTTSIDWCGDHPAFPKYLKEMESDNG